MRICYSLRRNDYSIWIQVVKNGVNFMEHHIQGFESLRDAYDQMVQMAGEKHPAVIGEGIRYGFLKPYRTIDMFGRKREFNKKRVDSGNHVRNW